MGCVQPLICPKITHHTNDVALNLVMGTWQYAVTKRQAMDGKFEKLDLVDK